MVKTLWSMLKDGLKAFLFWAVSSGILIYFFKYPGLIFSELLGLIFLAAFVATWGAQLLFWLLSAIGFARGEVRRPDLPLLIRASHSWRTARLGTG